MRTLSDRSLNTLSASYSRFRNSIVPVAPGTPQLTFPSLQDGASFRVPQATNQDRFQLSDSLALVRGAHSLKFGGEVQLIDTAFDLGVFQAGRIEMVQDFAQFDHNGDGRVDDGDLLFAVTLRSATPERNLLLDDCDNTFFAFYAQDDWRVTPELTLNLGLRWEMDTDAKNVSGYADTNPLVSDFYQGDRGRDLDNFGPRIGFNWTAPSGRFGVHGGWGLYYDRITLEIASLEKGLDGRALAVEVKAGNVFFLDEATGQFPPFAPSIANPFTGFILPGAGANGINIIDNAMETPEVQQWNLGAEVRLLDDVYVRADGLVNRGSHFIIGRRIGTVFNPVVGGPDSVINLESSVGTRYKGLLVSVEKRGGRHRLLASYTLSKADNYANDDQIPFGSGPIDPNDLEREFGPSPNDRRHRFTLAGTFELPAGFRLAPLLTLSTGVPMDILMPDGSRRVPPLSRNAGGRVFDSPAELNAYLRDLNAGGGVDGVLLPLVSDDARFNDCVRLAATCACRARSASARGARWRRWWRSSTCSTPRTSWARPRATTPASRTCWCATPAIRRRRATSRRRRSAARSTPRAASSGPEDPARCSSACGSSSEGGGPGALAGPGGGHLPHRGAGDRHRHLPDARRHGAPARLPGPGVRDVAADGGHGPGRRALLRRAGLALPGSRRSVRVPARGVGRGARVPVRVEVPAGAGSGADGRTGGGDGGVRVLPGSAVRGRTEGRRRGRPDRARAALDRGDAPRRGRAGGGDGAEAGPAGGDRPLGPRVR